MEENSPRPLYIAANHPVQITLDGPALRLLQPDKAPRWYPLVRVSRIVAGKNTEWQAASITACLEHGIPIVFVSARSGVAGWTVPCELAAGSFSTHLSELASRHDWKTDIDNWHRSVERRAIRLSLKRIKFRSGESRPHFLIDQVFSHIDRGWTGATQDRLMQLKPVVAGLILIRLKIANAPAEVLATPGASSILNRIWEIVRWDLLHVLSKEQHQPGTQYNLYRAAKILERKDNYLQKRIDDLIKNLESYLAVHSVTHP